MPEQLPTGWISATLGQITRPSHSRTTPPRTQETRYVGLEHIAPHAMSLLGHASASDVRSASLRFSRGDLLYGRLRPYLNKVWLAEFDGLCSGEFLVFPKRPGLNNRFLASRLNALDFVAFANERASGERPRVSFASLSSFPVLLPPSDEQDRIVARLNAAMSRVRAGENAAKRARQRIQRYREAVLQSAVVGELSAAWRQRAARTPNDTGASLLQRLLTARRARWEHSELRRLDLAGRSPKSDKWKVRYKEPPHPEEHSEVRQPAHWVLAKLGQVTWAANYGTSAKCTREANGVPVLRIPNIRNRRLDLTDLKFAPRSRLTQTSPFVSPGDMLVVRTNGSRELVGRATVITEPLDTEYAFASYLIRFRLLGEEPLWSWISIVWGSAMLRSRIESKAKTTAGQYNLSLSNLANITIPLPPIAEQRAVLDAVASRMAAADRLVARVDTQLTRAEKTRETLLRQAFRGGLVSQDSRDEPASGLLERLQADVSHQKRTPRANHTKGDVMRGRVLTPENLETTWTAIGRVTDAGRLFAAADLAPEQALHFYEVLRESRELRTAFEEARGKRAQESSATSRTRASHQQRRGRFRLVELWLQEFKNLKDYTIRFNPDRNLDVVLGWNGTGKSNLFEALVILFRELHEWCTANRWPTKAMKAFRILYELNENTVEILWLPSTMKRPTIKMAPSRALAEDAARAEPVPRTRLALPRFVFGYYSGPTNRMAEHFLPMKQAHYERLRTATTDDASTLAGLLEKRRFFCAETHHAKYVLLAFSYKEDPTVTEFLASRLRIVGFESALFVIRKPRWAKDGSRARDFWGATGIMRRVLERLRHYAIAPMIVRQKVSDGYRSATEEHYYFLLPDIESLHSFAAEYEDARAFFLALESTDFSELIHDVKIQVRVKANDTEEVSITFRQLSEGEQQLLMVLGLMRFTQSYQSLVLLDEPDTHLNPHWSVNYLKDLTTVMSEDSEESPEQRSSHILVATHDPLVIASLVKEQVHILVRDRTTGECRALPASVDPRGLGFAGILTSEMFGFRSDLDEETVAELDRRVRLVAKEERLTEAEEKELEAIDRRLAGAGFSTAFSDPYYAAFVRAWGRRHGDAMAGRQFMSRAEREEVDRIAQEVLKEALAEVATDAEE